MPPSSPEPNRSFSPRTTIQCSLVLRQMLVSRRSRRPRDGSETISYVRVADANVLHRHFGRQPPSVGITRARPGIGIVRNKVSSRSSSKPSHFQKGLEALKPHFKPELPDHRIVSARISIGVNHVLDIRLYRQP